MSRGAASLDWEPLERALGWLLSLRDKDGAIVCAEHRVEHTGKSACAAILAVELHRATGNERYFKAAVQQGQRLVARLEREGDSPCFTFRPGRHDPFNCSNSVIDGGACADALATLVVEFGERLDAATRDAFREAALLHARTYLRYAVLDKGIPAQRAWGLTGLAGAFALEPDPVLREAAESAVELLAGVQNADGSYPYHPLAWGAGHPGAGDGSAFYQSRVTGFLIHALERLGAAPDSPQLRAPLERGLRFLHGLIGVDGIKCGQIEAKPWYWGAEYEVASHPFDMYALARGAELFDDASLRRAARDAYASWTQHLSAAGVPSSHRKSPARGRSYQCPVFWAGHACWAARALPWIELGADAAPDGSDVPRDSRVRIEFFEDTQLVRLEDASMIAWVRGSRPPFNSQHGSPHGFGLLRVQRRADGSELVERRRLAFDNEAEWSAKSGGWSPQRGWNSGSSELRFSVWQARAHWRGGRILDALATPLRVARDSVLQPARGRASTAFARDVQLELLDDGVRLTGPLGFRDGTALADTRLERTFRSDGHGLLVTETLVGDAGASGWDYRVPEAAREVQRANQRVSYRLA